MFQPSDKLQHHKQYLQKLSTIKNNIAGVLPSLNTSNKIILDQATKALSPMPLMLPTETVRDDSPVATVMGVGSPSAASKPSAPQRSCGKETTSPPLPAGYIEDPVVSTVKSLQVGSKGNSNLHAYFTAIFYDQLNIAHGAEPFMTLSTLEEYRAQGVPSFQSKTFLHTIFLAGFHIENWPYCAPVPMAIDDTDFASPQSWASWKTTQCMLHLVCCSEGTWFATNFVERHLNAGNPPPNSIDFPKAHGMKGTKYGQSHANNYHWCYMYMQDEYLTAPDVIPPIVKGKGSKRQPPTSSNTKALSKVIDKGKSKATKKVTQHGRCMKATFMGNSHNGDGSDVGENNTGDMLDDDDEPLGPLETIAEEQEDLSPVV
ncbi:hypothetical protein K439DRAFT_1616577 [Ramaria rubella]|nr:hypothetical protein K439DRAFT_1616577 [Ramaria rubella]